MSSESGAIQSCATQFRNIPVAAPVYTTPLLTQSSGLVASVGTWTQQGCGNAAFNQAGNPLGLLAESVTTSIWALGVSTNKAVVRIINPTTNLVLFTHNIVGSLALGEPWGGGIGDFDGDGTADLGIRFEKCTTTAVPPIVTTCTQTRQVRNILTGAIIYQASWNHIRR